MARTRPTPAGPGRHGGRRRGAGRPPEEIRQLREEIIKAQHGLLVDHMPGLMEKLRFLADGGFERTSVVRERAELIFVDRIVRTPEGAIVYANGRPVVERVRAFPDAEPGTWIETKTTTEVAEPNLGAIKEVLNRIVGRPREAEPPTQGADAPLADYLTMAIERAYGAPDPTEERP